MMKEDDKEMKEDNKDKIDNKSFWIGFLVTVLIILVVFFISCKRPIDSGCEYSKEGMVFKGKCDEMHQAVNVITYEDRLNYCENKTNIERTKELEKHVDRLIDEIKDHNRLQKSCMENVERISKDTCEVEKTMLSYTKTLYDDCKSALTECTKHTSLIYAVEEK